MSISAMIQIQRNLQYPPLKKIDPNTQVVTSLEGEAAEHSFSQAAIPAILTFFFRFVQSTEGATAFLEEPQEHNWLTSLFGEKLDEVVDHISTYSGKTKNYTFSHIQAIANETVEVVLQQLPDNASPKDVQDYFKSEHSNILLYLPPALQIGKLLENNSIDDESHKMEGIVSSLIHNIGMTFDTSREEEKNS
jgi:hypothetical protein